VEGLYVLDLSLPPPPLLDNTSNVPRNNLSLLTTSGHITAEILVLHNGRTKSMPVFMNLRSDKGSVHAKVVGPSPISLAVPCFEKVMETNTQTERPFMS